MKDNFEHIQRHALPPLELGTLDVHRGIRRFWQVKYCKIVIKPKQIILFHLEYLFILYILGPESS